MPRQLLLLHILVKSNHYLVDDGIYIAMRRQLFLDIGIWRVHTMKECKKEDSLSFISTIRRRKVQSVMIHTKSVSVAHTSSQQPDAFPTKLNKPNKTLLDSVYNNKPL